MTSKSLTSILGATALVAVLGASTPARAQGAQSKAAAEALYQEGLRLMSQNKFDEACPKFVDARHLDESNGTILALATCFDKGGKTASAWALYKELAFTFKKNNDIERSSACEGKAAALEGRLSRLKISVAVDTPGLVVRRDNEDVGKGMMGTPIPVDPGKHVLEATAPGYRVWQTIINIGGERDMQTVTIPGLDASGTGSPLRLVSYGAAGLGVAGIVVGSIFGGMAVGAKSTLQAECPLKVCTTAKGKADLSSANTNAAVSTVGFAVGGAALATGVVLYLLSGDPFARRDDAPAAAQLIPTLGPQGGGLQFVGSF